MGNFLRNRPVLGFATSDARRVQAVSEREALRLAFCQLAFA